MIVGIGIDLTEIDRINSMLTRFGDRFTQRIFTEGERGYSLPRAFPAQHLAARFAAKEATLKALGVPKGLSWHEMDVRRAGGKPVMHLTGAAQNAFAILGGTRILLTLSHTKTTAAAVVVIDG